MNKKAIELSLQAVVIGIILLVVLGVVLYIFGSNIGKQNSIIGGQLDDVNNSISGDDTSFVDNLLNPKSGSKEEYLLPMLLLPTKKRKKKVNEHNKK
jgi:hypothetical protein